MSKSLGQVFHEAFIARLHAREPMIGNQIVTFGSWGECDETYKADTESAAQAVVEAGRDLVFDIAKSADLVLSDQHKAVIEAAEALAAKLKTAVPGFCLDEIGAVANAVEALQEARDE